MNNVYISEFNRLAVFLIAHKPIVVWFLFMKKITNILFMIWRFGVQIIISASDMIKLVLMKKLERINSIH